MSRHKAGLGASVLALFLASCGAATPGAPPILTGQVLVVNTSTTDLFSALHDLTATPQTGAIPDAILSRRDMSVTGTSVSPDSHFFIYGESNAGQLQPRLTTLPSSANLIARV